MDIYKDILDMPDVLGAVCKYIANSKCGFQYDFGYTILPKGSILYRIRSYKSTTDYSDIKEWGPSPYKQQNRCNQEGETALYLGSSESICLLETNTKYGEQYAIARFEVVKDIELGGFIYIKPEESNWKKTVGSLLNSFLIAPSRSKNNEDVLKLLDSVYTDRNFDDISLRDVIKGNLVLPFRIGAINRREEYYKITNELCSVIKGKYPKGMRYSSCWIPFETVGIECSEYNIVLYEEGLDSIRYLDYEIKTNTSKISQKSVAEVLIQSTRDSINTL